MKHTKQWFINRIGKRIYCDTGVMCGCQSCVDSAKRGFVVKNKKDAEYHFLCQNEMGLDYSDRRNND